MSSRVARMRMKLAASMVERPLMVTTLFYGIGILLPALALRALWFQDWGYLGDLAPPSVISVLVAAGGTAVLLVATPRLMRFDWATWVAELTRRVFGPLNGVRATWLGVVSGFCEELLFRGALQPAIGLVPAAILFAMAHCVRGWWLFALAMGLALGALYSWTGNLWPCILAHVLLNAINLYRLSRFEPAGT